MLQAALRNSGLRLLAGRAALGRGEPMAAVMGRRLCSKPKDGGSPFQIPLHRPTAMDKRMLLWGGRFKKESDIPEFVSYEMVDAAKSKVRIKFAVFMIFLTAVGCVAMIISGKRAVQRHESLASINLEKKAQLKAESEK